MITLDQVADSLSVIRMILDEGYSVVSYDGIGYTSEDTTLHESPAFAILVTVEGSYKGWFGRVHKYTAQRRVATLYFMPIEDVLCSQLAVDNNWVMAIEDPDYEGKIIKLTIKIHDETPVHTYLIPARVDR